MLRVGSGYDAHKLVAGRRLVLGGVEVPFEKGLDGHSDADVLTHAVCDALLGAAALGDIGRQFPPENPEFKDIESLELLRRVKRLLLRRDFTVTNIDATIVAQEPKLAPYTERMRENVAAAAGIGADCVSVKATTEEGMGFTGNGEGVSAHATVIISSGVAESILFS